MTLFNLGADREIYRFNYTLMTNELKERGKKGQHIFENVNLSNVFWGLPKKKKKAISKCHLWLIAWRSGLNQGDAWGGWEGINGASLL